MDKQTWMRWIRLLEEGLYSMGQKMVRLLHHVQTKSELCRQTSRSARPNMQRKVTNYKRSSKISMKATFLLSRRELLLHRLSMIWSQLKQLAQTRIGFRIFNRGKLNFWSVSIQRRKASRKNRLIDSATRQTSTLVVSRRHHFVSAV